MKIAKRFKRNLLIPVFVMIIVFTTIIIIQKTSEHSSIDKGDEPEISLYLHQENKTIRLSLEDYVSGSLAAEMPASFELEALKAQAVCIRTYSLRKIKTGHKYPMGADLSDDINSCQAYISPAEFTRRHPQNQELFWEKIKQAVSETRGEIMIYEGEPLDALYHSTCGGRTESANNVWGKDVPYLQSVKCEYCSESKFYSTEQVFSSQELQAYWGIDNSEELNLQIIEKTSAGRIKKLQINNCPITGEQFRQRFQLPSKWWSFKSENKQLIINSRGYGHGVGLCQYGANGMAKKDKRYRDILSKYYLNIQFHKLDY